MLAAGTVTALVAVPSNAAAAPRRAASPPPLDVVVTTMSPVSLSPGENLTVTGTITNHSSDPVRIRGMTVGVGSRVTSRTALADDFAKSPGLATILRPAINTADGAQTLPSTLQPHGSTSFSFKIDADEAGLDVGRATVYPLVIRLIGPLDDSENANLGEADTYIPFFPGSVAAPLRVVWVWPIDATPALDAEGSVIDPAIAQSFATGRLHQLVELGGLSVTSAATNGNRYAPVTWAIEPSLLQTAAALGASSEQWLADLKKDTSQANVIALPYGDPDAVALVRAGLTSDLANALALGRVDIASELPGADVQNVAWPVNGAVDQATIDAYAGAGVSQILLAGSLVPPNSDASVPTQSAPTDLESRGPTIRGLAIDPDAQQLLAGNGKDQPSPSMSEQRLLALLAVAVAEEPNQTPSRDVVLALPRDQDPDATWIRGLLHDTASLPWLQATTLADTKNDPAGDRNTLQPYPSKDRASEIAQTFLVGGPRSIATLREQVADLRTMLPDDRLTRPIDEALTRAESIFSRPAFAQASGSATAGGIISSAENSLAEIGSGVRVAVTSEVTLTSTDGKIPVTVDNTLDEAVTVRITLSAGDRTKLQSTPASSYTIAAKQKQRVLIPVKAERSGSFRVALSASTPSGRPLVNVPLTIHSKAYGTVTLVITLTALGVLVIALAFRAQRRLRRWRSGGRVGRESSGTQLGISPPEPGGSA